MRLFSNISGSDEIDVIFENMSIYQIANEWEPTIDTVDTNYYISIRTRICKLPLDQTDFNQREWGVINLLNDKFYSMRKFSEDVINKKISLEKAEEKLKRRIKQFKKVAV